MSKVVAVVVTYNRKKLLVECIDSILNQSRKVDKIIIIDNNSTDGTEHELKNRGYFENLNIEYLKLESNMGGAGGFFEGMKLAHSYNYDWIWIMDDDTIPKKGALEKLLDASQIIDTKISFLASSVFGINGEVMNVPILDDKNSENGYPNWYLYLKNGIVKIKTATFVSLLINNDAINKYGLPVKDYFIWGDDTEYTTRLTKYYAPAYFVGSSEVVHKRKISKALSLIDETDENRLKMFYYNIRNNYINIKNYHGTLKLIKYIVKNLLLVFKILFSSTNLKVKKIKTVFKGIFDGVLKKYDYKSFENRMDINYFK